MSTPSIDRRLAVLVAALLAGCPSPTERCVKATDCDDGDPSTADSCGVHGECEHAAVCQGELCSHDPCSPSFPVRGGLRIAMLDVGQGDAIAVLAPSGCAALIDGGPSGSGTRIKSYLKAQGVSTLDFAVASHYHADHVGGLDEVAAGKDAIAIPKVYDRGEPADSSSTFSQYAAVFHARRQAVTRGQSWTLCDEVCFKVEAVNADGASSPDENAQSVVVRLSYGAFQMLLGGDLTGTSPNVEADLSRTVANLDVYKVHHHGSATSSTASFLAAVQPSVSLISVGWDNSFGHPNADTVSRLRAVGSGVWMTEDATHPVGNIELSVGSTEYKVSQGATTVGYVVKGAK